MTEASLQINFANRQDLADPYWLRMELVEEDTQMTIGEAATLIDELYHTSICGEEQTPLPEPEDGSEAKPSAADWTSALQNLNLPTCEAYNQWADDNPGGYEVDIKVFRSHQKELYKLILSNGYAGAPRRVQERIELTLAIDGQSSILLDSPIYARPRIAWTDIDGPDINIMGNTLWWQGNVTGTIRAEFDTVYDLVHIRVTGTQTGQTVITGTDESDWLGLGWYSGSETGEELTDVQDIQCSVLAFYHYQYEELVLNRPEIDESVEDANLSQAVCGQAGSTSVNDDDEFDPTLWDISACKEACTRRYDAATQADELAACQKACERECFKRVEYDNICVCGGDESSSTEQVPVPCPDGYNSGSAVNGFEAEAGGTRFIDCGPDGEVHDPLFYEQKCCVDPGDMALPECEKHYAPFTSVELDDEQKEDITQAYGADANIIMVGPAEGRCGETVTEQVVPSGNCCEGVSQIYWDFDNSVEVIADGSSGVVAITGGVEGGPFYWEVRGDGFSFDAEGNVRDAFTSGRSITIYANDSCGGASISVTDSCSNATGAVRSDSGVWHLQEDLANTCPFTADKDEWTHDWSAGNNSQYTLEQDGVRVVQMFSKVTGGGWTCDYIGNPYPSCPSAGGTTWEPCDHDSGTICMLNPCPTSGWPDDSGCNVQGTWVNGCCEWDLLCDCTAGDNRVLCGRMGYFGSTTVYTWGCAE